MTQDRLTIFFGNPKVSGSKLIEPHYQETVKRINAADSKYVLAIQDQMRLNFTDHFAKTELGRIGKSQNTDQYGLIMHNTLCITDANESLGLIDVQLFDYDEFDTTLRPNCRTLEDKASRRWLEALQNMRHRLGEMEKEIITVADRESDFYDFLYSLTAAREKFVIRAKFNRNTGKKYRAKDGKIWDLLDQSPTQGTMTTSIQDSVTRENKEVHLHLKAIEVRIPAPYKPKGQREEQTSFPSFLVNAVKAYDDEHAWVLLTNLPIASSAELQEIVNIYKSRWHIEDFHKALKIGYQVDEIYLHRSRAAIESLLIMASISACRLYWLTYTARNEEQRKADQIFENDEWRTVYIFLAEEIPKECPSIADVVMRIARLGGYKSTKSNGPPGIKTLWIGFQKFNAALHMYRMMSSKT